MRTQFAIRVLAALTAFALAAPALLAQSSKKQPQQPADVGIELGLWDMLIAGRPDIKPTLSNQQRTRLEQLVEGLDSDRYRQLKQQTRAYANAPRGKRPTDEEQKALTDARRELDAMLRQLRGKVTAFLTPAQSAYLFSPYRGRASGLISGVLRSVALSGEQKAKLEGLAKQFDSLMFEPLQQMDVMTPEQKQRSARPSRPRRAAGKTGRDLQLALQGAVQLSDEQKAAKSAAQKEIDELDKRLVAEMASLLTAEQRPEFDRRLPPKLRSAAAESKNAESNKAATPADGGSRPGLRDWTDKAGKPLFKATFRGVEDGYVKLEKADGTIAKLAFDSLSEADQQFVVENQ